MRKPLNSKFLTYLLTLAVVIGVVAIGTGAALAQIETPRPSAPVSTPADTTSPQAILSQAVTTMGTMTAGTGDFTVDVTISTDPATMPAAAQIILGAPITLTGTYGFDANTVALDVAANVNIAGQSVPLGVKALGGQAWILFMGTWYETASALSGNGGASMSQTDLNSIIQAVLTSDVDPTTWFTDLTLVGQEPVGTNTAYHLSGMIDVDKMLTDVWNMLPSGMMGNTGNSMMPTQTDLQDAQAAVNAWLENLTLDIWVDTTSYQIGQVAVNANVVPPAGQLQGITSIAAQATVTINPATTPLTVTPPTDARPFSELEMAFNGLTELLSAALGGGTTSPSTTGTTQMMPGDEVLP